MNTSVMYQTFSFNFSVSFPLPIECSFLALFLHHGPLEGPVNVPEKVKLHLDED